MPLKKEEINVTLEWVNIASADLQNRYPLIHSSEEPFDLIFTANWINYTEHANNGAFIAMDDYFKYAPILLETVPEHFWAGMKADDGHFYAMPSTWQYPRGTNVAYRDDLRKKYGTPEITTMDTLVEFWDAVLAHQSENGNMFPINLGRDGNIKGLYDNYHDRIDNPSVGKGSNNIFLTYLSQPEKGFDCYYFEEDFEDWVIQMKEWMDKGYWSRSAQSSQTNSEQNFQAGTGSTMTGHYDTMRGGTNTALRSDKAKAEGWEVWVFRNDQMLPGGKAAWITALQDCVSIARQTKSVERCILLIEQLNCNQEVSDLIQRGIEGVNWTCDEQGRSFVAEDQKGFGMNAWCFRNALTYRDRVFLWPRYKEYDQLHRQNTVPSPNEGFRLQNANTFSDFMAEVESIVSEYHIQMLMGLAADPVAALTAARQRLTDAGIADYLAEVNKQWDAWWAENKPA